MLPAGETKKLLPDKVYKSNQLSDDSGDVVLTDLGPEEKFAGNVLKSLKEKISEARKELQELEQEIETQTQVANDKKEEIIQEARQQAEQIKQDAEAEARELLNSREEQVEEAREEGYDDGYEDGWEKAREDTAEMLEHSENMLDEARRERQAFISEHEAKLVELASAFAEKVIRAQVEIDDETAVRAVREALEQVQDVKKITVVLNPEDYERVNEIIDDYEEAHPSLQEITLAAEEHMDKGGCRIRTDYGDLDGSIRGQVEHYANQILREL